VRLISFDIFLEADIDIEMLEESPIIPSIVAMKDAMDAQEQHQARETEPDPNGFFADVADSAVSTTPSKTLSQTF